MTVNRRDIKKLSKPILMAIALLTVAALLAGWSADTARMATLERDTAVSRNSQIEQRLRLARNEEQELKDRAALFQRFEQSGIIGEEKRLDWTELLRETQQGLHLPGMSYEFGVQKQIDSVNGVGYTYFSSPLRIHLRLVHEEDLLNFLGRIQQQSKAMVLVRGCKMAFAAKNSDSFPKLEADCEMQWLTLRRATGAK